MRSAIQMKAIRAILSALVFCLLLAGGSRAQDTATPPPRDPAALAARFLGYDGSPVVPPLPGTYAPGDTTTFLVPRAGSVQPVTVTARLASGSPGVYVWVDTALEAGASNLVNLAPTLEQIFSVLALRENYYPPLVLAGQGAVSVPGDELPVPDVDNDRHIHVLFTRDLGEESDSFVRTVDSLPAPFAPDGAGNARETILVNTSSFPNAPLADALYLNLIINAYQELLVNAANPGQAAWLREALAQSVRSRLQDVPLPAAQIAAYYDNADLPLFAPPPLANRPAVIGGQQLFLAYLTQRFGAGFVRDLWSRPGAGIAPLEAALMAGNVTDLVTGAPLDLNAVFADFVVASLANAPIGDGRFMQTVAPVGDGQILRAERLEAGGKALGQTVQPYGVDAYAYQSAAGETVTVRFRGDDSNSLLRLPTGQEHDDVFFWSGRAPDTNPTLTRALDLTGVEAAELTFDAAWDLSAGWDYSYVSASADGGQTWTILPAMDSSASNPQGLDYGPGFTGVSNPDAPRPFPILGVAIGPDGMTAAEVPAGTPAALAGLRAGDMMIGYDGQPWDGEPNVLGLLASYQPGDTLNLLVRRDGQPIEIPVVLGTHPTRRIEPEPLWLPQSVDLTPFAGQSILLRFETVTQPGRESGGLALDNLAVAALGWADDGAGDGWALDGWAQTVNTIPQPWLVQAVTTGSLTTPARVLPLLGPDAAVSDGEWTITLTPGETLLLTVSAVNADAARPATYNLSLEGG
ncbi:MAG: immune inhibitor A [Anaerolineae bacterium]|nr:immune inhibitor A [Anaerolineae bacterium]